MHFVDVVKKTNTVKKTKQKCKRDLFNGIKYTLYHHYASHSAELYLIQPRVFTQCDWKMVRVAYLGTQGVISRWSVNTRSYVQGASGDQDDVCTRERRFFSYYVYNWLNIILLTKAFDFETVTCLLWFNHTFERETWCADYSKNTVTAK